jgi:hypothetical protein
MKTKFFFLIVVLGGFFFNSFAQSRVLTPAERYLLVKSDTFQILCEDAVMRHAVEIQSQTGAGLANETAATTWAKGRILGTHIIKQGGTGDNEIGKRFVNLAINDTFALTAGQKTLLQLLTAWTTAKYNTYAAEYFKVRGDDINMSIGN